MILRPTSFAARVLILVFALASAIFLGYFSVRSAVSVFYADKETLAGYQRAVQLEPGNARGWYELGRYLQYNLEDPDPVRAIRAYQTSLGIDPRYSEAWLDLAASLEATGDLPASRAAFLKAKKAYPLSAEVSWRYGNFLLRQGELDGAFSEIRSSVQADPNRAAEAYSRSSRVEPDIEKILDRVLPPSGKIYLAVMQELAAERQVDSALKVWKRLLPLHPTLRLYDVSTLVYGLRQNGRIQEAREAWRQAGILAGFPAAQIADVASSAAGNPAKIPAWPQASRAS